jgi:tetratricopeptide (TPR) repeat protein
MAGARTTPPAEPPSSAQEQRIGHLLDDAQRLWQANRLTLPQGASAYDRYQAVLQIEPENVVAKKGLTSIIERYQEWSRLALEREQYAKVIGYYQWLLTITRPDAAIYYALGSAHHKAQQYTEAMQVYEKALQLEPNQKQVHQAMATLQTEQLTTALQAHNFKHVRANIDADHRLTLSGYVVNDAEEAHVLALAQAQPGIEQVINRLKNRLEVTIEGIQQGSFTSGKLSTDAKLNLYLFLGKLSIGTACSGLGARKHKNNCAQALILRDVRSEKGIAVPPVAVEDVVDQTP